MKTIGYGADKPDATAEEVIAEPEPEPEPDLESEPGLVSDAEEELVVEEDSEADEVAKQKYGERFVRDHQLPGFTYKRFRQRIRRSPYKRS